MKTLIIIFILLLVIILLIPLMLYHFNMDELVSPISIIGIFAIYIYATFLVSVYLPRNINYTNIYTKIELTANEELSNDSLKYEIEKFIKEELKEEKSEVIVDIKDEKFNNGIIKHVKIVFEENTESKLKYIRETKEFQIVISDKTEKTVKVVE